MFTGRTTIVAAVAVVLLASAPGAEARPADPVVVGTVVRTIAWVGWSAGADGTYRPTTSRRPFAFTVAFPYALSSSNRASASRR
ncbi:MAG TPA: hypothetical protein VGL47_15225 [Amycolatopsis sp.]|uniref:Secreted protein n=1 Tax=Amycolatopsis nalaikhensis TaxID=715472 RepID=A0ABY8Y0F8_9PSEU|nr:hypothetical protein [Amycolatopsis sp. 2-2]WIV61338.1 hypothetical protein QP939_23400 [Amycolatopsis sp. 2-2]